LGDSDLVIDADPSDLITLTNVEKQYGGLRPLRVRELRIPAGRVTMLIGFDRPAAEVFVNLITGASLPETGEVITLGRPTQELADGDEWLTFVERFGIVSDRVVLLEAMTVAQNLALPFDLQLDPIPPEIRVRVISLAAEVGIEESLLETRIGDAPPLLRSRVNLARALALDPAILVLEHPTANLPAGDAKEYARAVKSVSEKRPLTTVGLLMDEKFAKATGGRLLMWQPATGELRPPSRFALRRSKIYF
jgi:ABC-type transporter Mla maintaining outer membrane lipid asymmetry ATPase subunit MlaF